MPSTQVDKRSPESQRLGSTNAVLLDIFRPTQSTCKVAQIDDHAAALIYRTRCHACFLVFQRAQTLPCDALSVYMSAHYTEQQLSFCTSLPKVELHAHLNGSLRDSTIR